MQETMAQTLKASWCSESRQYAGVWYSAIQYLQVYVQCVVCLCVCVGEGLFALIIHKRKTVVCILNTLIPWSTSPLPCYLPAPGALITVGNDAVILGGGEWVGGRVRARDRRGDRQKEKERGREGEGTILVVSVFPSCCLWLFFPLLINCWNITVRFGAHIAVVSAQWVRLHLNVLWSRSG